jgi:flagellar motor component MotA
MAFVFTGLLNMFFIFLVFLGPFILAGGYVHVLWQPFEMMTSVGSFAFIHMATFGIKGPSNNQDWEDLRRIGKAGFIASMTIIIGGIIHTMQLLDQGSQIVGHSIAAILGGVLFSIIIYVSFYCGPYKTDLSYVMSETNKKQKLITIAKQFVYGCGVFSLLLVGVAIVGICYSAIGK